MGEILTKHKQSEVFSAASDEVAMQSLQSSLSRTFKCGQTIIIIIIISFSSSVSQRLYRTTNLGKPRLVVLIYTRLGLSPN